MHAWSRLGLLSALSLITPALAQSEKEDEKAKEKKKELPFAAEGKVEIGAEVERFKNGKTIYEAELELKTKRKKGARVVLELEVSSKDRLLRADELYIDKKHESGNQSRIGLLKRDFGLEYEKGSSDRFSLQRSVVYKKLENLGIVGREFGYSWRSLDEQSAGPSLGLFYAESGNGNLQFSYVSGRGQSAFDFGSWTLIGSDKIDAGRQLMWAQGFAMWQEHKEFRYETEIIVAKDPEESEFQKSYGHGHDVMFWALKQAFDYRIDLDTDEWLRPLLIASFIVHDSEAPRYNTWSVLVGLHYQPFDDLLTGFDIDLVGTNSRLDPDKRTYEQSEAKAVVRYVF